MTSEIPISKVTCPKGHDIVRTPYGAFRCNECGKDYSVKEVLELALDRSQHPSDPYYKPSVYGKPN